MRKTISGMMMLTLLSASILPLAFSIGDTSPASIYIRADGSIDPPTAPILNVGNVFYTFTGNIDRQIVVYRSNIVIEGNGFTVDAAGFYSALYIYGGNVTVKNVRTTGSPHGFWVWGSGNYLINNTALGHSFEGIHLMSSDNHIVIGNRVSNSIHDGIVIWNSRDNVICGNNFSGNGRYGIVLASVGNTVVSGNNVSHNGKYGIWLIWIPTTDPPSLYNRFFGNTISHNNIAGIVIDGTSGNTTLFHNNIVDNTVQAYDYGISDDWNVSYPVGGNYWSDYTGVDLYSGPYQNEPGWDGIGDTPYTIDGDSEDRYPLMEPYIYIPTHNVAISDVKPSETAVPCGASVEIKATVENQGDFLETFNVTAYANTTAIGTQTLANVAPYASMTITFTWNTTDANLGKYLINANATTVPGETNTEDNAFADGIVWVIPAFHDVAITNVESSHNFLYIGDTAQVYVNASNLGNCQETLNVTVYADTVLWPPGDEIVVGNKISLISARSSIVVTIPWDTTSIPPANYTLSAFATPVPGEEDIANNIYLDGKVEISEVTPCPDINIVSPGIIQLNPSIFNFNNTLKALQLSMGNMTITSTGFEGNLRVVGSKNNTVYLCINQPGTEKHTYYLPKSATIEIPLWLVFEPGTYSGTYELNLTVCGTYRSKITVEIVHIWVCKNGAYNTAGGTACFSWSLACPAWVYLKAETILPPGWTFSVDPPLETAFETPRTINLNITSPPDAKEGDVGIVTLMAFDNETNTMFWHFTYFASIDAFPPVIEEIQIPTHTIEGGLLFNTTVKDPGSGIESVQLLYQVNDGPWNNQTMNWQEGDTFNSTVYTLKTPPIPNHSTLKYYLIATDWLGNQTQSDTQTITIRYDIATTNITTQKTVVCQGYNTDIQVTIQNRGTISENDLKVALYADTTLIQTKTVSSLVNGTSTTLTFNWNTTDFAIGNYTINAFAVPVTHETDTADNACTDGWVCVALVGDVNADCIVDIEDIYSISLAYGSRPSNGKYWHSTPCEACPHSPNMDINSDKIVDIEDIYTAALHYGETYP